MSRQRTLSRLTMLEANQVGVFPRELVARLALEHNLTEAEIIAEAEHLIRQFAERGATTWEEQVQLIADERGIPAAELQAELDAILAEDQ